MKYLKKKPKDFLGVKKEKLGHFVLSTNNRLPRKNAPVFLLYFLKDPPAFSNILIGKSPSFFIILFRKIPDFFRLHINKHASLFDE